MRNTGSETWPESTRLVCVGGDASLRGPRGPVPLSAPVPPGEEVVVAVTFTAPAESGRVKTYWRLEAGGRRFGQRVWADVFVENSNADDVLRALKAAETEKVDADGCCEPGCCDEPGKDPEGAGCCGTKEGKGADEADATDDTSASASPAPADVERASSGALTEAAAAKPPAAEEAAAAAAEEPPRESSEAEAEAIAAAAAASVVHAGQLSKLHEMGIQDDDEALLRLLARHGGSVERVVDDIMRHKAETED